MNSHAVFCPNPGCPARGRMDARNTWIHARTPPRYRRIVCGKTFSPRIGTPSYRRLTAETVIAQAVTLVAYGCPLAAIVAAYGVQRQTVIAWADAAGMQGEAVHWHLVCQPRDLGAVQADEMRVRQQGKVVWMALAGLGPALARRGGQPASRWSAAARVGGVGWQNGREW
jgi:transposase-like protein